MKGRWHLSFLAVAILACVGLAQTQQGHVVLSDVGLYQTPAPNTELAFSQPGALPSVLEKSNGIVKVSFSIHNASGDPRSYQWSILLVHLSDSQAKASGSVLTPALGRTVVTKSVAAACVDGRLQVVVRLASPAESISFWMTCPAAATKKQAKQ
jgi:hypothetical protein